MYEEFDVKQKVIVRNQWMCEKADEIINEYLNLGYRLTVRQLHYQFVSRDLYENTQKNYKELTVAVRDGRNTGLLDWDGIEDRTRSLEEWSSFSSPAEALQQTAETYAEDWWEDQSYYPEVWIEKDALVGVIEKVCSDFRVPYYSCRGYASTSDMYKGGKRFAEQLNQGKTPVVLQLSDHDPEGIDITRDIARKLELYAGEEIEVRRLGLTIKQARRYRLPPNFAKPSSTRYARYVKETGTKECWELDALRPNVIVELIKSELEGLIDDDEWEAAKASEERNREQLKTAARELTNPKRKS